MAVVVVFVMAGASVGERIGRARERTVSLPFPTDCPGRGSTRTHPGDVDRQAGEGIVDALHEKRTDPRPG